MGGGLRRKWAREKAQSLDQDLLFGDSPHRAETRKETRGSQEVGSQPYLWPPSVGLE